MKTLYAKYLEERTSDQIIERSEGFATYRYLNENQVYIIDIYVLPEFRELGIASILADNIAEEALKKGCKEMLGTVVPSTNNATTSIMILIAYGMSVLSSSNDLIIFKKDI